MLQLVKWRLTIIQSVHISPFDLNNWTETKVYIHEDIKLQIQEIYTIFCFSLITDSSCHPSYCLNGGSCSQNRNGDLLCLCFGGWAGVKCTGKKGLAKIFDTEMYTASRKNISPLSCIRTKMTNSWFWKKVKLALSFFFHLYNTNSVFVILFKERIGWNICSAMTLDLIIRQESSENQENIVHRFWIAKIYFILIFF